MDEIAVFGELVLVVAAGVSLALLGRLLTERFAIPSAALFLLAAAAASDLVAAFRDAISFVAVERIAVVALIVILFDGGMEIGWRRLRHALVPVLSLGLLGTFMTAALIAAAAHWLLGLSWLTGGLLGAALAPTDPAVTFSGARRPRGTRPNGDDPEGRVGRERPGRDRAHDRDDPVCDERRRLVLDRRARVHDRDGGRPRRRAGRRRVAALAHASRPTA